jgi:hypothetical protein
MPLTKSFFRLSAALGQAFFAASFMILAAAGCSPQVTGSGNVKSETRPISGANSVSLDGVGDLTIIQGEPENLVIEAEDNVIPMIRTEVNDGLLEITEKGSVAPQKPIRFTLTVSKVSKVICVGAGKIHADKIYSPALLDFRIEGTGTADFSQIECSSVKVVLSGTGGVKLQGHARNQNIDISGAGSYSAADLRTQEAKVNISGAGKATVWAVSDLDAIISGVGSVDYYGVPKVKKQIEGVGSIHSLGDKPRD